MHKDFKDMTTMERLEHMRKHGVALFPNLNKEEKRQLLHFDEEEECSRLAQSSAQSPR